MKTRQHVFALIGLLSSSTAISTTISHTANLIALTKAGRNAECVRMHADLSLQEREQADNLYVTSICALRDNRPFLARSMLQTLQLKEPQYAGLHLAKSQADYVAQDPAATANSMKELEKSVSEHPTDLMAKDWILTMSERATRHEFLLTMSSGIGHSTNANAGSNDSDFLGTPLPQGAKRTPSNYSEIAADVRAAKATGLFSDITGTIRVSRRANANAAFANQTMIAASVRFSKPQGHWLTSYSISGFDETVDTVPQRRYITGELIALRRLSDRWEVSAIGRAGKMEFRVRPRPDLDVWRLFWNVNASRLFAGSARNRVGAGVFGGGDEEVIRLSNFGNSRAGFRIFADTQFGKHVRISAEAATSLASFDGHQGFNGLTRLDKQNSIVVSAAWKPRESSNWTVQFRGMYRQLDSNVSVFRFNQKELGLFLMYRR